MGVKYKKNRIKSRICWAIALVLAAAMLVISVLPCDFAVHFCVCILSTGPLQV